MISSMTAFSRCGATESWGQATWEIRSVNHRYLDVNFKIPDNFREWEQTWRHLVAKRLNRGKVDAVLLFRPSPQTMDDYRLNEKLVEQLISNCQTIMQYPGVSPTVDPVDLLRWPDVVRQDQKDISSLKSPLTELLEKALDTLSDTRQREGEALSALLHAKLQSVLEHVEIAHQALPLALNAQRQKILQRLAELQVTMEPQRIEQELVLYAQRMDVEEEIQRLKTHVKETQRVIEKGGSVGRRLDFLMQEMGREANTLSSKSLTIDVTQEAIELKVIIEQMREQIQNVE